MLENIIAILCLICGMSVSIMNIFIVIKATSAIELIDKSEVHLTQEEIELLQAQYDEENKDSKHMNDVLEHVNEFMTGE